METALVPHGEHGLERANSLFFDVQRFAHAKNVAEMLARSTMVPEHFRGNLGNCVIALNLADRIGVDVFMMMQSMYIVHGRPGIEGKLVIALISASGRFSPLEFDVVESGKRTTKNVPRPDACVAFATDLKTGKIVRGPAVTWDMVTAEGWDKDKGGGTDRDGKAKATVPSKWVTLPDLMFRYRSATLFGRVHCPGAMLGLRTTEEIEDIEMVQVTPGAFEKAPLADDPEPDTVVSQSDALAAFDASVPKDADMAMLERFLSLTAKANGVSVEQLKAGSVDDLPGFWKIFGAWCKQEAAKTAAAKKQATAASTEKAKNGAPGDLLAERFECPNGGFVTVGICEDCKSKIDNDGYLCPAYAPRKPN